MSKSIATPKIEAILEAPPDVLIPRTHGHGPAGQLPITEEMLLDLAGKMASVLIENDPDLSSAENLPLKTFLRLQKGTVLWSKIS